MITLITGSDSVKFFTFFALGGVFEISAKRRRAGDESMVAFFNGLASISVSLGCFLNLYITESFYRFCLVRDFAPNAQREMEFQNSVAILLLMLIINNRVKMIYCLHPIWCFPSSETTNASLRTGCPAAQLCS